MNRKLVTSLSLLVLVLPVVSSCGVTSSSQRSVQVEPASPSEFTARQPSRSHPEPIAQRGALAVSDGSPNRPAPEQATTAPNNQADDVLGVGDGAVSVRAVAPTLPGGVRLGLNVKGRLEADAHGVRFKCSKQTVEIPYDSLIAAKTRVEKDKRLWFFTYVPAAGADEQILVVHHAVNSSETERLLEVIVDATGFERRDGVPGGTEYRRPGPRDAASIAALTKSTWSEFDRRVESTAPSLSVLEPSIEDRRSVSVSLTMVYDDGIDAGRVSLMYVGDGWLWLAQEITVALPGDDSMRFERVHSKVVQGGTCVEVMSTVLDRASFQRLASGGFAMEVPRVGVVRMPGYYFGGLVMAFDQAKTDHGVAEETATSGTR